jgi:hypothetical protein
MARKSKVPFDRNAWRVRCEYPDGRFELIECASEEVANQKADELLKNLPGVTCYILQSLVAAMHAEGLVPVRPHRDGWLWDRVTVH